MALGKLEDEVQKKIYLSISHGKVVRYLKEGGVEYYRNVEGRLVDVYQKDRNFNGQIAPYWYLDIRDKEDLYSLSIPYDNGVFKSIILALASSKTLTSETPILIEPYEKNQYTKVAVYENGEKLNWLTKELPDLKEVVVNGKTYTDTTERMEFIASLADKVKKMVTTTAHSTTHAQKQK